MRIEDLLQGFRNREYSIKRKDSKTYYSNIPYIGVTAGNIDGESTSIPPMFTFDMLLKDDWEIYPKDFRKHGVDKSQLDEGYVYKASHDGKLYFKDGDSLYRLVDKEWVLYDKIELAKEGIKFIKLYKKEWR